MHCTSKKALTQVVVILLFLFGTVFSFFFIFNWINNLSEQQRIDFELGETDVEIIDYNSSHVRVKNNYERQVQYIAVIVSGQECDMTGNLTPNSDNLINIRSCIPPPSKVHDVSFITNGGVFESFAYLGFECTENASTGFFSGTGSSSDPYQVCDCAQLQSINNSGNLDGNRYFDIAQNIDCGVTTTWNSNGSHNLGFAPIGDVDDPFDGQIEGNNFRIDNLYIYRPTANYTGLIGATSAAWIRNLGVTNVNITGKNRVSPFARLYSNTHLNNSYSTGYISGNDDVGGLSSSISAGARIYNSYSSATVSGTNSIAGIVTNSINDVIIAGSYFTGTLQGETDVGGIIAKMYSGTALDNSYFTGTVNGSQNIGGLVGSQMQNATVNNSYSTGSVTGTDDAGGLVGYLTDATITNSYSSGSVTGANNIGGLVGTAASEAQINDSYSVATVNGTNDIGGLAGLLFSQSKIYRTYSSGDVEGTDDVGGFIGEMSSDTLVEDSYATGDVNGTSDIGGLVGLMTVNRNNLTNVYAIGNVTGISGLGGLVGDIPSGSGIAISAYWDNQTSNRTVSALGESRNTSDLVNATSNTSIYVNWSTTVWNFGTASQYPTLN